ncbi:MAG: hypothetical protein EPN36_13085 [Rhodanobacteraceae bacterium]|nr:MAG: hypothetical protein EPN36_13085 [Rhodanobacteraceae bacterium]
MVKVTREGGSFIFEVEGVDKLWALKSRLEIPASDIRAARRDPAVMEGWKGLRLPGTEIPGLLTAGTFLHDGRRVFWDVHHPARAVVVDLQHEHYDELVIEVEDPDAVITLLNLA